MNRQSLRFRSLTPRLTFAGLAVFLAAALTHGYAARAVDGDLNWPQWRGPNRDSQIVAGSWPIRLNPKNFVQQWRVPLGPSYSGPVVFGDHVFVTETEAERSEIARALDRTTGKQVWGTKWAGALKVPFFARSNGDWIRATPACDGERLYVAGMRDVLVCLDVENGEQLWRLDCTKQFGTPLPTFGLVCSPLVWEDHVYVQAGGGFLKLKSSSGELVWRVLSDGGGMNGSAFSSPVVADIQGKPQLLVQTRSKLAAVEPDRGRVLWSRTTPAFRGMNILTPTVMGSTVFTSSYGGNTMLLNLEPGQQSWAVNQAWTNKAQAYMSSPVVINNYIYLHLRNQRLTCIDSQTGATRWTTQPFGKYWSMVANGDQILALDERGDLMLIAASPEKFQLLDRIRLKDNSWAHLAVSGPDVYVRDLAGITAYRWSDGESAISRPADSTKH